MGSKEEEVALIFGAHQIHTKPESTLASWGIEDTNTVFIAMRLRGGDLMWYLYVRIRYGSRIAKTMLFW